MTRVERWERRCEVPLVLLALAFLLAYAWPVLDPRLDAERGASGANLTTFGDSLCWATTITASVATWILGHVAEDRAT